MKENFFEFSLVYSCVLKLNAKSVSSLHEVQFFMGFNLEKQPIEITVTVSTVTYDSSFPFQLLINDRVGCSFIIDTL